MIEGPMAIFLLLLSAALAVYLLVALWRPEAF
jgi:K+-transporting ATPase KdpF subunit